MQSNWPERHARKTTTASSAGANQCTTTKNRDGNQKQNQGKNPTATRADSKVHQVTRDKESDYYSSSSDDENFIKHLRIKKVNQGI